MPAPLPPEAMEFEVTTELVTTVSIPVVIPAPLPDARKPSSMRRSLNVAVGSPTNPLALKT